MCNILEPFSSNTLCFRLKILIYPASQPQSDQCTRINCCRLLNFQGVYFSKKILNFYKAIKKLRLSNYGIFSSQVLFLTVNDPIDIVVFINDSHLFNVHVCHNILMRLILIAENEIKYFTINSSPKEVFQSSNFKFSFFKDFSILFFKLI